MEHYIQNKILKEKLHNILYVGIKNKIKLDCYLMIYINLY